MPKPFSAEFRRDVVAAARQSDQSIAAIARSLGVSESCLSRWLRIADQDGGIASDTTARRPTRPEPISRPRNRELRRRAKQVEHENEILRRATAYFARDVLPQ